MIDRAVLLLRRSLKDMARSATVTGRYGCSGHADISTECFEGVPGSQFSISVSRIVRIVGQNIRRLTLMSQKIYIVLLEIFNRRIRLSDIQVARGNEGRDGRRHRWRLWWFQQSLKFLACGFFQLFILVLDYLSPPSLSLVAPILPFRRSTLPSCSMSSMP